MKPPKVLRITKQPSSVAQPAILKGFDILITDGQNEAYGWKTDNGWVPSNGYGGHPITARPKRSSLTVYEGREPFQIEGQILLYRNGSGVEIDRKALETMASTPGTSEALQPSAVQIKTNFPLPVPPFLREAEWWLEDLVWEEEVRNEPTAPSEAGHLIRGLVTITLLERIDDETLNEKRKETAKTNRAREYRVKKPPDTLASIAAKELGSASKVQELKALNPQVRSDGQLKNGMILHIPPKK